MQTLLQCMAVQVTAEPAAAAFRNLSVRCTSKLQDGRILFTLIDAVKGLLVQGEPPSALLQQSNAVGSFQCMRLPLPVSVYVEDNLSWCSRQRWHKEELAQRSCGGLGASGLAAPV